MTLALAFTQPVGSDRVEVLVDQRVYQMERQIRRDRIVPRCLFFVVARGGSSRPIGSRKSVERQIADRLAVIDDERRHVVVVIEFLVVIADNDQSIELGTPQYLPEVSDPGLRFGMARGEPLRRQLDGDVRLGAPQKILVARRLPLFVEKIADPVTIDKPR